MRNNINDVENENIGISIFKIMDYMYCPRIIYYENIAEVSQNKGNDFKDMEEKRQIRKDGVNRKWIWEQLRVKKESINILSEYNKFNVLLRSRKNHFYGVVDEILFLKDETVVPLYYYNSKFDGRNNEEYKYKMAMYSMLIEENYNVESKKGYILFLDGILLKKFEYNSKDFEKIEKCAAETLKIIELEKYPIEVEGGIKCRDCYYKKICGR